MLLVTGACAGAPATPAPAGGETSPPEEDAAPAARDGAPRGPSAPDATVVTDDGESGPAIGDAASADLGRPESPPDGVARDASGDSAKDAAPPGGGPYLIESLDGEVTAREL